MIGMPEGRITLADATIALALAPKSNAVVAAIGAAAADVTAGTGRRGAGLTSGTPTTRGAKTLRARPGLPLRPRRAARDRRPAVPARTSWSARPTTCRPTTATRPRCPRGWPVSRNGSAGPLMEARRIRGRRSGLGEARAPRDPDGPARRTHVDPIALLPHLDHALVGEPGGDVAGQRHGRAPARAALLSARAASLGQIVLVAARPASSASIDARSRASRSSLAAGTSSR